MQTASGPVALASDAAHFRENLTADHPPPILHSVPDGHAAFDRLRELAGDDGLVVPGHDPQVAGDVLSNGGVPIVRVNEKRRSASR